MLYEVITNVLEDAARDPQRVGVVVGEMVGHARQPGVITSYSIHYTKLYEAPFGAKVMEELRARGHEILAACVPPDKEGRPTDPLKEAALAAGVPVVQRKSYKTPDAMAEVDAERADVGVLAYSYNFV